MDKPSAPVQRLPHVRVCPFCQNIPEFHPLAGDTKDARFFQVVCSGQMACDRDAFQVVIKGPLVDAIGRWNNRVGPSGEVVAMRRENGRRIYQVSPQFGEPFEVAHYEGREVRTRRDGVIVDEVARIGCGHPQSYLHLVQRFDGDISMKVMDMERENYSILEFRSPTGSEANYTVWRCLRILMKAMHRENRRMPDFNPFEHQERGGEESSK